MRLFVKVSLLVILLGMFMFDVGMAANQDGELVVALSEGPDNLDPQYSGGPSMRIWTNIYEALLVKDADGNLKPALAESWETIDNKHWRFNIRKGVKFHSGRDLNAKAVKDSFDRYNNPDDPHFNYSVTNWIKDVKVIDDYTIIIESFVPFSPALDWLSTTQSCVVVDVEAVKEYGDLRENPVGTGPFELDKWEVGRFVRLRRNENYWGQKPDIKYLTFEIIPEESTRMVAFLAGDVDLVWDVTDNFLPKLKSDPTVDITSIDSLRINTLELNFLKPIIKNNPSLRKAISLAIDTDTIVKQIIGMRGSTADSVVLDVSHGYFPQNFIEYDPKKAVELLNKAGWIKGSDGYLQRDGKRLELDFVVNWERDYRNREVAEAIQGYLEEIGIKINLQLVQYATYVDIVISKGEQDMDIMGWGVPTNEFYWAVKARFHSNTQALGDWGTTRNMDPKLDEMIDSGLSAKTEEELSQIFKDVQLYIYENTICIPLYYVKNVSAKRNYVKGITFHPNVWHPYIYNNVSIDK